jgi:ABC-type multidrug transport system fused ATPase/permease subunit
VDDKQTLGTLISGVTEDMSKLVRGEIELVKTEIRETARTAGQGTGLLVGAGVFAFLGLVFLLLTLAWVLVELGLPTWAGFGIVTLLVILTAVVMGLVGRKQLETVKGPERAQASMEKTKALFSRTPSTDPLEAAVGGTTGAVTAPDARAS